MHPILDYVEFRTNPEPYVVRGVVHGGLRDLNQKEQWSIAHRASIHRPGSLAGGFYKDG
jgi:hypothetical protein